MTKDRKSTKCKITYKHCIVLRLWHNYIKPLQIITAREHYFKATSKTFVTVMFTTAKKNSLCILDRPNRNGAYLKQNRY